MGARWAISPLLQALLDSDSDVAETALNTLGRLASPDDFIVVYVLKELTASDSFDSAETNHLAQSAQALLKKWRRGTKRRSIP